MAKVVPKFPRARFIEAGVAGLEGELTARGRHLSTVLHDCLAVDYPQAVEYLMASLGPVLDNDTAQGMAPFFYLPHVYYVSTYGLDFFEPSMAAQHAITQRFSAEYSIRPFLEKYPQATLARLEVWTQDPSHHVRRLVSEGTRPRLPWAPRLPSFQKNPQPILGLLERLKDDPSLYVRRSVANNLNDIGKDHPDILVQVTQRWLKDASPERQWVVQHALRSAIKRGEKGALLALGFGEKPEVAAEVIQISPTTVKIGQKVALSFDLVNTGPKAQTLNVDLVVHFIKANGQPSPKVFKLKPLTLTPGARGSLKKTISLEVLTTRQPYPGRHDLEAQVNGQRLPLGFFEVI